MPQFRICSTFGFWFWRTFRSLLLNEFGLYCNEPDPLGDLSDLGLVNYEVSPVTVFFLDPNGLTLPLRTESFLLLSYFVILSVSLVLFKTLLNSTLGDKFAGLYLPMRIFLPRFPTPV